MASSNRHWPSMFRSNPGCNQPDMNNSSSSSSSSSSLISGTKPPFSSGCEDRSPEPKPRWNPKPEQIRILEAIFNSGMVNPPRDEIRRIRLQLQQYGQVGDANVFYWFQNRKSRSKNKLRAAGQSGRAALARACAASAAAAAPMTPPPLLVASVAPTSSSSSSSDRSSGSSKPVRPAAPMATGFLPAAAIDLLSPLYYNSQLMAPPPGPEFTVPEPLVLQWPQSHYFSAPELAGIVATQAQAPIQPSAPGVFLGLGNELLGHANGLSHYWCGGGDPDLSKSTDAMNTVTKEEETAKLGLLQYAFGGTAANAPAAVTTLPPAASIDAATVAAATVTTAPGLPNASASSVATSLVTDQLQGIMDVGVLGGAAPMATVTVARHAVVCTSTTQYSVPAMHLNVRLFGDAAVLFRDTGEPVLVDKSGVTVEPLEQGAVYYVLVD